uniref:Bm14696 n=1 Tax=Brugia malayi TaxID=6279 RepID=A0A0J9XNW3_BRUMA|nr:Bm14696 [Brugia malayi]
METLECVGYSLIVNVAGSNKADTHGKICVNIEFRTRNQRGEKKLRNTRISVSEFVGFLQELRKMQGESMQ